MRLNLACGTDVRNGWVNLDIVAKWPSAERACDHIWDARKDPIPFDNETASEIYAGYLLLHLAPRYHDSVLREIHRVLSPQGVLLVGEVDMDVVMRRYLEDPTNPHYSDLIWGEQGNLHGDEFSEFDKHCQGFTRSSLESLLSNHGFGHFQRINIHAPGVYYELTISCQKLSQ